ncbi:hypothetical protein Chor_001369 [Crotalus horridus]
MAYSHPILGYQLNSVECVDIRSKRVVPDQYCHYYPENKKPKPKLKECNMDPCPSSQVPITQKGSDGLSSHDGFKEIMPYDHFQPLPRFVPEPWSPCSASCGHGTQRRDVKCHIYLAFTQAEVELPDEECEGSKPLTERSCRLEPCDADPVLYTLPFLPSEEAGKVFYDWEYIGFTPCSATCNGGPWTQCTATCGVGIQTRQVHCQQPGGSVVGSESCKDLKPHSLQACNQLNCPPLWHVEEWQEINVDGIDLKEEKKFRLFDKPQILGIHKVYIQTRQEKRINFTVGSRAYLLPKTSVIVRCPVRRFQKMLIRWEKDGQPLQISKHLGVTKSGSLKINNLEASDTGAYKCIAGSAQEIFVLKLIGTSNKLLESATTQKEAKWHQINQIWQLWSQKSQRYLRDEQVNDQPASEHLKTQRRNSEGGHHAHGFTTEQLKTVASPNAYSMDTDRFDELIKNLSHLIEAGEISNDLASQFVYQLIAELVKPSQSAPGKGEESANEKLDKSQRVTDNLSTKTVGAPIVRNSKGAIMVKPQEVYSNETVTLQIGGTFLLTKNVSTINLLCAIAGVSNLKYTWTKDGVPLKPAEK